MSRLSLLLFAASLGACSFDARGLMPEGSPASGEDASVELDSSVPVDSAEPDTESPDAVDSAVADTSAPDTSELDTAPDTSAPDTAPIDTAPVDAGPPPFCDPSDKNLIACWELEDNGKDGSSYKHDLAITGSSYVKGFLGKALDVGPAGKALSGNDLNWAVVKTLTVEMWINPKTLPTGTERMGLVVAPDRFGFFLKAPGVLQATTPENLESMVALTPKTWTHVAFTFDALTMTLWVNGAPVATKGSLTGVFGLGATLDPVTLGSNSPSGNVFDGQIDQVRIFRYARTAKQLCSAAGTC